MPGGCRRQRRMSLASALPGLGKPSGGIGGKVCTFALRCPPESACVSGTVTVPVGEKKVVTLEASQVWVSKVEGSIRPSKIRYLFFAHKLIPRPPPRQARSPSGGSRRTKGLCRRVRIE